VSPPSHGKPRPPRRRRCAFASADAGVEPADHEIADSPTVDSHCEAARRLAVDEQLQSVIDEAGRATSPPRSSAGQGQFRADHVGCPQP
jgi:hypothetical protein